MMNISVSNIGKAYKTYPNRWARLLEWISFKPKKFHDLHWVIKDINFTVARGEAVGIIGLNGAGKSTLLKMITGTTTPTAGTIEVKGRIAAILELGMGFHPDFTGRQNAIMSAQLQGIAHSEIPALLPEIEKFADIGSYFDHSVRTYSSGMQARLAFAVATAARPDILIVDEALAVGDVAFQRKCHRRIEEYISQGTSLLYVSHDTESVKKICAKALFLDAGTMVAFGESKTVCDLYENKLFGKSNADIDTTKQKLADKAGPIIPKAEIDPSLLDAPEVSYGNGFATIHNVWIENSAGQTTNVLIAEDTFSVCYSVTIHEEDCKPVLAMLIKNIEGLSLYGTDSILLNQPTKATIGKKYLIRFQLRASLAPGIYFLNSGIRDSLDPMVFYHRRIDVLMFKVQENLHSRHAGLINLNAKLSQEVFYDKPI